MLGFIHFGHDTDYSRRLSAVALPPNSGDDRLGVNGTFFYTILAIIFYCGIYLPSLKSLLKLKPLEARNPMLDT